MRMLRVLAFACLLSHWTAEARADGIQLPCDPSIALSLGGGTFSGHTSGGFGEVTFHRMTTAALHLEAALFQACRNRQPTRNWFARLNVFGGLMREKSALQSATPPKIRMDQDGHPILQMDQAGNPLKDDAGEPIPQTQNGLSSADISNDGAGLTSEAGLRLSLYDDSHFVLLAYGQYLRTFTFGWDEGAINDMQVHLGEGREENLDVTAIAQALAKSGEIRLQYKWSLVQAGATFGFRSSIVGYPVTLSASLGYLWFNAKVRAKITPDVAQTLTALGVNPMIVTTVHQVDKSAVSGNLGMRLDLARYLALEIGGSASSTMYAASGSMAVRFDLDDIASLLHLQ